MGPGPHTRPPEVGQGENTVPELADRSTDRPAVPPVTRQAPPVSRAEWTAPDHARLGLAFLLVMAVAGSGVLALRQLSDPTPTHLRELALGLAGTLALALAAAVAAPRVVRVRDAVVTVHRGMRTHRFDLADGTVTADLGASPADPGWTLLLRDGEGVEVTVRRREVDATVLDHVVRHHRSAVEVLHPAPAARLPRATGLALDGHRRTA